MTPEEVGLLVMQIQDDDVRPSTLVKFLQVVTTDEEVRRNARLVSNLSGLAHDVRVDHCRANILTLLADSRLAPAAEPKEPPSTATSAEFGKRFSIIFTGPWKQHVYVEGRLSAGDLQKRLRGGRGAAPMPPLKISRELATHVKTLEEFWGVTGTFLA